MKQGGRIIAFPGYYLRLLGVALLLVGAVIPAWWAYLRTRAYFGLSASVTVTMDGPVRPAMIVLPTMPSGKRFAISERPVTYGEFFRVVGEIRIIGFCGRPLPLYDSESPVICVPPREAAYYANLLTDVENQARRLSDRAWLTPCYRSADVNNVDMSCTGYRLPTVEEWSYAATLGSVESKTSAPDAPSAPNAQSENTECRSATWFISGMCDAREIVVATGRDGGSFAMKADNAKVASSPYALGRPATFRIVRTASEPGSF